jgi:hypothetical protein
MDHLHKTAVKHINNAERIKESARLGVSLHLKQDTATDVTGTDGEGTATAAGLADMLEFFLYGFLDGFSYKKDNTCESGLTNIIYYLFEAYKYKTVTDPSNTMQFAIAMQKFTESTNTIYAYCLLIE